MRKSRYDHRKPGMRPPRQGKAQALLREAIDRAYKRIVDRSDEPKVIPSGNCDHIRTEYNFDSALSRRESSHWQLTQ